MLLLFGLAVVVAGQGGAVLDMKFTAPIITQFGPPWVINSLLVLSTR